MLKKKKNKVSERKGREGGRKGSEARPGKKAETASPDPESKTKSLSLVSKDLVPVWS